jgi:hypothetical protein
MGIRGEHNIIDNRCIIKSGQWDLCGPLVFKKPQDVLFDELVHQFTTSTLCKSYLLRHTIPQEHYLFMSSHRKDLFIFSVAIPCVICGNGRILF